MPQAIDFETAYDTLGNFTVEPGGDHGEYYVEDRLTYRGEMDDMQKLERTLERACARPRPDGIKLLVSGHKGTGKSSELKRIANAFSDRFEIVHFQSAEYINESDVDVRDILFAVAGLVVDRLRDYQGLATIEKDPEARSAFELLGGRIPTLKTDGALELSLFGTLKLRIRTDTRLRDELREAARDRQEDLLTLLNRLLEHLRGAVERPVLLIIDDLDRLQPELDLLRPVFTEDFQLLLAPRVSAIYTLPMEVHHDAELTTIFNKEHKFLLGHIKLWTDRGRTERFDPGWAVMHSFVNKRVEATLFAPEAVERAIALSGGSFQQLRWLLRTAVDHADWRGDAVVGLPSVSHAVNDLLRDFVRAFGATKHLEALARIHDERAIDPPGDLHYLRSLVVLEHVNDKPWFDVNPIFLPHVESEWTARRAPSTT